MTLICGIDEAGRGPVVGSLVIAGCMVEEKDLSIEEIKGLILSFLEDLGRLDEVSRNSKRLSSPDATRILAEEVFSLSGVK